MDKFATLEPVKLYTSFTSGKPAQKQTPQPAFLGRLPLDLHVLVLSHLPVPDIPAYAASSRALSALLRDPDSQIWKAKWTALGVDRHDLGSTLDELERKNNAKSAVSRAAAPPTLAVDDEFGDFADADVLNPPSDEMGDFVGAFNGIQMSQPTHVIFDSPAPTATKNTYRAKFIRAFGLLKPLVKLLDNPPHLVLSQLADIVANPAAPSATPLLVEAQTLRLLSRFLSQELQPVRRWEIMYPALRSAMDRFDANMLAAFDTADSRGDEPAMREAAESSWQVWDGVGDWELGKVWAEKREIFYQTGDWNPLDNFTEEGGLAFDAMDSFMEWVLSSMNDHGARAVRVFPPASQVLLSFADRVATEVVGEYVSSLLSRARELSTDTYLKSVAASFRESWRMVDAILAAATQRENSNIPKTQAEDVIYRMFEANMDEYLDEEVEVVKMLFDTICKGWDNTESSSSAAKQDAARFLASQNPAQVKRNVLGAFTNLLLLPVTIVPRTVNAVGGALMTGGSAAVQGISMLNPARWGATSQNENSAYSRNLANGGGSILLDEDDELPVPRKAQNSVSLNEFEALSPTPLISAGAPPVSASSVIEEDTHQLDLLLSLDVALELIHADREALKRVEIFAGYPGHYGHRVKDTIEELFILFLQALGERHVTSGFYKATERMKSYKPAEHHETANVAPLEQFFELVHMGDTIQSMVQVYFDKELAPHIDKTDFLNAVVREKKRFENALDDSVAAGLNAGTEVLMNQVDHIITTLTKPREYYPPEDGTMELGPTHACQEAIKCLEVHCKLLKGSTSKEVLEVFYQEVGIRLIAILQKHIKRQIISLNGGFQIIADLNAYNTFITSLKVQSIISDFANLKMLGHVYVVEDAKDLAQIDIYEFIQRRSDWKKIEKIVDKTMYNLSFKEDCIIT
ncbi:hypothetical protein D9611_009311 [Ephemerocybe angulata]|uniref:F-box domain-containing protein n=1 Tax=Ephemerocybe angulata TaxID=980116 RepID=A0A8H5BIF2_9AGAR|nr:hypothetical protein D9611_009311 [Tulosesus angulatus]